MNQLEPFSFLISKSGDPTIILKSIGWNHLIFLISKSGDPTKISNPKTQNF
jgi:hypothetical protein